MDNPGNVEPIRILNIITRLNIAGGSRYVLEITRLFNDEGYESTILYGNVEPHEQDMLYLAQEYGLQCINLPTMGRSINLVQDLLLVPRVWRIIRRMKPDIVHTHTAKAGMAGRIAAKLAGVPVILHTFHGNNFKGYFGKVMTQVSINIERILSLFSTRIIAISEQQRHELLHFRICREYKLEVIPLGFNFERLVRGPGDRGKFRNVYGIDEHTKLVAFIGRLAAIKDPYMFLDIAQRVCDKQKNVVFAFVGDGEMADDIKNRVKALGLESRIIFTGFITNLRPLYADLDILLLTSVNEGTPVAIIEALANKVLVVATRVGGVPNLIKHRQTGFLYARQDHDNMAEMIVSILNDPSTYKPVTERAYREVTEKFSSQRLRNDLGKLFAKLLNERRPGTRSAIT